MRRKFSSLLKARQALKRLEKTLDDIGKKPILVEGKRDKGALGRLGFTNILTVSGNLKTSCSTLSSMSAAEAVVLTDLDRRGNELAKRARQELEGLGIKCIDLPRKELARLLGLRFFEEVDKKYEQFIEEVEKFGIIVKTRIR